MPTVLAAKKSQRCVQVVSVWSEAHARRGVEARDWISQFGTEDAVFVAPGKFENCVRAEIWPDPAAGP